jgi:phosphatidyl-myo-inositol dimannoside synthase
MGGTLKRAIPNAKRLDLLIAANTIYSAHGGIETHLRHVLAALKTLPQHTTTTVICLEDAVRDAPTSLAPQIVFHGMRFRPRWLSKIRFATTFAWLLLMRRPRAVLLGHPHLVLLAALLCKPLGIRFFCMVHFSEVAQPWKGLRRWALQASQRLVTLSDVMSQILADIQDIPREKFRALPCCIETERFTPGPASMRVSSKIPRGSGPLLLTVSRLDKRDAYKGIDTTLRALPLILKKYPHALYVIVGTGNQEDEWKALARALGLEAHCLFLGAVAHEDLPDLYRLASCFVMPSWEGFGIVYLEALASGVPVIAGDNDGSLAPLQGSKLGWHVCRTDPFAVAAACLEALSGQDPRCQSAWLRAETEKQFGVDAFRERARSLFAEALTS